MTQHTPLRALLEIIKEVRRTDLVEGAQLDNIFEIATTTIAKAPEQEAIIAELLEALRKVAEFGAGPHPHLGCQAIARAAIAKAEA